MSAMHRLRPPWLAVLAVSAALAGRPMGGAAAEPRVVVLADRGSPVADLACPLNGQTVFCLDAESAGITAVDPSGIVRSRDVVGAAADGPRPLAIACIDTNTLAAVCRGGADWSVRTWRVRPAAAAPAAEPLQVVRLGTAEAEAGGPQLVVGHSRDWLAVAGLPPPLPPLVRGPIAGATLGRIGDRGCPPPAAGGPPLAVAVDPFDELVRFTAAGGPAAAGVSFHDAGGRTLLELACDVPRIRDAACGPGDGTLWVVGGDPASADRGEGLWRIDAAMQAGRQVVRPVRVVPLAGPRAVVCVGDSAVVVAHGDAGRRLVRIDLVSAKDLTPAAAPDKEPRP